MADNWSETALGPLLLQWQGCVAKLTQTSTLSLWPSNTPLLPFIKAEQLGRKALAQRFTAHSGVVLIFQNSWYDRAVPKCEPAVAVPEALPWLHPGQRDSGLMEFVNRQAADAEE